MKITYFLDVLKPHQPSSDIVARTLMKINGVKKVKIQVDELDQKTASLHIKVEGIDIILEDIDKTLEDLNCALHSVDEVIFSADEEL
ncbi:MAG: hypothetical protein EU544_01835 [Promethearchaeota archaeon]|nr:MAG: hypothetical protein EU544_01835 [Candidatus Lokiarchaeota archaeon]